ncbi:MAG TPA: hypothetical protein VF450_26385 [Noviherbaspirillum sp.]
MKNILLAVSAALALVACSTAPTTGGGIAPNLAQTPAQVAAQICPIASAIVTDLSSPLAPLTLGEKAAIAAAGPVISTACALGTSIDLKNYQNLMQAVPQLIAALESSANLSDQAKSNLFLLQVIVNAVAAEQAAKAGAVQTVTAAPSAPAASTSTSTSSAPKAQ